MATTTLAEIKARIVSDVKAITPESLSDKKFDRCPRNVRIRDWAPEAGSAAFRKFEILRTGPAIEPENIPPGHAERENEEVELVIAYPILLALYRTGSNPDDYRDMDDLIRADARQIFMELRSTDNFLPGHLDTVVSIGAPEREEKVWYQPFTLGIRYYESTT